MESQIQQIDVDNKLLTVVVAKKGRFSDKSIPHLGTFAASFQLDRTRIANCRMGFVVRSYPSKRGAFQSATFGSCVSMFPMDRLTRPYIAALLGKTCLRRIRGEQNHDHTERIDQAGDLSDPGVITTERVHQHRATQDAKGRYDASEIEADAGTRRSNASWKHLG